LSLCKLVEAGSSGSFEVAHKLATAGIANKVVHKTTVVGAARKAAFEKARNLIAKKGPPPKGLMQATKVKRRRFAVACKKMNWKVVMFTDMMRFYLKYHGSKVKPFRWVLAGHEGDGVYQPTNPQCVNVYACITPYGMTAVHIVAGTSEHQTEHKTQQDKIAKNITKSEYKEVLTKTLIPEGTKLFEQAGISMWYLQQDNDPSHGVAAQVLKQWNAANGASVQLLPNWPHSRPDLNIIGNVWALVHQKVNSLGRKNFEKFKQAIGETFVGVQQHVIDDMYNSLERRMRLVIKNNGGYTKY
jgi:hypothetical protein